MAKQPTNTKVEFLNLDKIKAIDFEKGQQGEAEKILEENHLLIQSTQVDSKNLKLRFEV